MKHVFLAVLLMAAANALLAQEPDQLPRNLVLDLDADRGVTVEDGDRVSLWQNQVAGSVARDFVKRDEGRKEPGSGRPALRKAVKELQGHCALVFLQQELVCMDEDAFDSLTQGGGCTWLAVLAVREQRVGLKDVNSFFGNLRNGGNYEGLWGCVTDDNKFWWGSRNGITFGRFDANNPQLLGPKLEIGRFTILAGRMAAGIEKAKLELFVNSANSAASTEVPVNPKGNPSRMAVGQERDAINHPGVESFDGEIARLLIFARPLDDAEFKTVMGSLRDRYGIQVAAAPDAAPNVTGAAKNDGGQATKAEPMAAGTGGGEAWPFDAAEAVRRQAAAAKAIGMPVVLETRLPGDVVIRWRLIPAGRFMLGSPESESGHEGDETLRPEVIAKSYYIMETQMTVAQYQALLQCAPADGSEPQMPAGIPYRETVDTVLPAMNTAKMQTPAGWTIFLPDRARMEYAARAGVATMNPGGDKESDLDDYGWYSGNSGRKVHPVGLKKPNAWGLLDPIGNRWHWLWVGKTGDDFDDASTLHHLVYGGAAWEPGRGNGTRLTNIMVSPTTRKEGEGVRFVMLAPGDTLPPPRPKRRP